MGSGSFEIDFGKYLEMAKEFDATEQEQRELIAALWQIMLAFFDFKFGIHPVQSALAERKLGAGNDTSDARVALRSLIAKCDDLKEDFAEHAALNESEG